MHDPNIRQDLPCLGDFEYDNTLEVEVEVEEVLH